ncbi:MAG: LL-diaminopimelate aminotransferase [Planctomycetes bacterium RBG_16_59_8]|nr:MAG: LL-diaminopimelate aminotransferase [Planctomycetes bacterium RBG_16_59_8]
MAHQRSQRLDRLPPYLFAEMERKKKALQAQGKDIINLGIGDPDQPPPKAVLDKLTSALHDGGIHQYSPTTGTDEFRQGIAAWMKSRFDVTLDPPKEILLGVGSKEMIAHLPLAFTNPGDVVLFPEPGYPPYRSGTIFALCEPHVMPLTAKNRFLPDLAAVPESVWKRAKIVYVNYPNNPTGTSATPEFYAELVGYAKRYGVIVVSDAAYAELYYEKRPVSFLETKGARDVGIEVHSMTKTFNMAGWRVAWAAGNAELIETLRGLKANFDSGQFMALQKTATFALNECGKEMGAIREMYRRRRDVMVRGLRDLGWEIPMPESTFYLWFPVPFKTSSMLFADLLLEKANVVVTPGSGFGTHGEGYARIALTVTEDRLAEAVRRIAQVKP